MLGIYPLSRHMSPEKITIADICRPYLKAKVKFSHTRYRAVGPELIPAYRQSARR